MRISEEVMGHLSQMFDEMEAAIKACPDSLWRQEDQEDLMMVPAFLAGHAVWCMGLRGGKWYYNCNMGNPRDDGTYFQQSGGTSRQ